MTQEEVIATADDFQAISSARMMNVCSVIDGYHLKTVTLSKNEVHNVRSFYSGYYQTYGVNVQAAVDTHCRFQFIGVAGPGVMGDHQALLKIPLGQLIEQLPGLYAAIGDCAYKATEHCIPIYGQDMARFAEYDNFNYYASQLRIRVKMAFGLMVKKFGILQHPMSTKIITIKRLVGTIARLHNYCINERPSALFDGTIHTARDYELSLYEQSLRVSAAQFEHSEMDADNSSGFSHNRHRMVKIITASQLDRPGRNRNKRTITEV